MVYWTYKTYLLIYAVWYSFLWNSVVRLLGQDRHKWVLSRSSLSYFFIYIIYIVNIQDSIQPCVKEILHIMNIFRWGLLFKDAFTTNPVLIVNLQVGKGRDVGLNQIALFEGKVSGGNGEQVLSRDIYRLGQLFDFFRMMSFYFTTVGYYFCTMVCKLCIIYFLLIAWTSAPRLQHNKNTHLHAGAESFILPTSLLMKSALAVLRASNKSHKVIGRLLGRWNVEMLQSSFAFTQYLSTKGENLPKIEVVLYEEKWYYLFIFIFFEKNEAKQVDDILIKGSRGKL